MSRTFGSCKYYFCKTIPMIMVLFREHISLYPCSLYVRALFFFTRLSYNSYNLALKLFICNSHCKPKYWAGILKDIREWWGLEYTGRPCLIQREHSASAYWCHVGALASVARFFKFSGESRSLNLLKLSLPTEKCWFRVFSKAWMNQTKHI